jgi:hypothetical protein
MEGHEVHKHGLCTHNRCLSHMAQAVSYHDEHSPGVAMDLTRFLGVVFWVPNHMTWMCCEHKSYFSKHSRYYDKFKHKAVEWQSLTTTQHLGLPNNPATSTRPHTAGPPAESITPSRGYTGRPAPEPTHGRELKEDHYWVVTIAGLLVDSSLHQCAGD